MPELNEPILFINFKTYEQATGEKALALARSAEEIHKSTGKTIVLVVQAVDLRLIASSVSLPVFAQHLDHVSFGSNTGSVLPEAVKESGAIGTVLNHAENKRSNEFLEKAIAMAKEVGLIVMVCAENIERAKEIAVMEPDFIAVEPPELIGGDISVSNAKPELISDAVKAIHSIASIPVITGAGIKSSEDVKKAMELGSKGVFVASGIIKASDSKKAISSLLEGFT